MDFMRILQSLEEFIYEVMTWLLFYPRTMLRVIRRPLLMLSYSDREQKDAAQEQYTDTISPPLFLMITILLSHLIELSSHQHLPKLDSPIAQQVMASEQNLLIFRSLIFSIYPLMFATARLRREHQTITRETLRAPFYAQCYIAAPAALLLGIGAVLGRNHHVWLQVAGLACSLVSFTWFIWVETRWFRAHSRLKTLPAARLAFTTWFKASFISGLIGTIILGGAA